MGEREVPLRTRARAGASGAVLLALALSCPFLLLLPSAGGEDVPGPASGPHLHFRYPDSCPRCHVLEEGALARERFVPGADAVCLGCHSPEGLGITHPTSGRPAAVRGGMTVPDDLPLDDEGRVFCLTCHRAHGPFLSTTRAFPSQEPEAAGSRAAGERVYRTYFARRSDPVLGFAPLCEGCHGKR